MTRKTQESIPLNTLHRQAEEHISTKAADPSSSKEQVDPLVLKNELEVHTIELEVRQEELQRAQREVETLNIQYRDLYDLAPIGYFLLDGRGKIVEANLAGAALLGIAKRPLQSWPFLMFLTSDSRSKFHAYCRRMKETDVKQSCVLSFVNRKGTSFEGQLEGISLGPNAQVPFGFRIALLDITDRLQAEEEKLRLRHIAEQHEILLSSTRRLALNMLLNRTGKEMLHAIAEAACSLVHARYAALGITASEGGGLQEFITVGFTPEQEAAIDSPPKGIGVPGFLLEAEGPIRIDRLSEHPDSVGLPPNHPWMERLLGVPIQRNGTNLGCLYLWDSEDGRPFTEADETVIVALAEYAAVALHFQEILDQQRALTHGFIKALEEERRAVAYDLHDGLTQYVMACHLNLNVFYENYAAGRQEIPESLEKAVRYLQQAVVESRRLVNGLRSLALDDLGLVGALQQLLAEEKARAGWQEAEFQHNIMGQRFDADLETAVYRVAQEALTNARKHAESPRVQLTLHQDREDSSEPAQLSLEVRDWGRSFEVTKKQDSSEHMGLNSMAERVHLMHGTFHIACDPGLGTRIIATFPIPKPDPREDALP